MAIKATIVEDSVTSLGHRLTTVQLQFHRFILSEFNTHRVFSRNASSSRAIPVAKMIAQVVNDPAIPVSWGKNQKGMQANEELSDEQKAEALRLWLEARDNAVQSATLLGELGLHKQITNRLLEPWMWTHVVLTSTEWDNFFGLRCHKDAMPEMQTLAYAIREAMEKSTPTPCLTEWHLPYVQQNERRELDLNTQIKCSVARCARVSYVNHDGTSPNVEKDMELYDRLVGGEPMHASPIEHQACPNNGIWSGNFFGWEQFRKTVERGARMEF
jgi:thymidylate synthase ThyX